MSTTLKGLLAKIEPAQTIDAVSTIADRALNTYPVENANLSGSTMMACLARFLWHLDNVDFRTAVPLPYNEPIYEGKVRALLTARYGQDALMKASDRARLGLDGGLRGVLQDLAAEWRDHTARERIRLTVAGELGGMNSAQRIAAAEEYAEQFAHLLPPEYLEAGRLGVKLHLVKILEHHPFALKALHQAGR